MTSEEIVAGYENILAAIPEDYFDRYTAEELGISEEARKSLRATAKQRFEEKRNSPEWRLFEETIAYEQNLPFYPENFFETKTAEELRISEQAREILIQCRKEAAERMDSFNREEYERFKREAYEKFISRLKRRSK